MKSQKYNSGKTKRTKRARSKPGRGAGTRSSARANHNRQTRTPQWMEHSEEWYRSVKQQITLRVDRDVLAWFRAQGGGYQTRINEVLRRTMLEGKRRGKSSS